jgi:hypothetical protein
MFQSKIPFCYEILGKFVDSEVVYTTRCIDLNIDEKKSGDTNSLTYFKSNILCLCEKEVALIGDNLEGVKMKIEFLNIDSIMIDTHYGKLFKIIVKSSEYFFTSKEKLEYTFVVDNRQRFLENLEDQYLIFFSKKFNIHKILNKQNNSIPLYKWKIFETLDTNIKYNELFKEENKKEYFIANMPTNHKKSHYKNYMYYLKSGCDSENIDDTDTYIYKKNKEFFCKLIIDVKKEIAIENLIANPEIGDFSYYCYHEFFKLINEKLTHKTFWITRSSSYIKKMNLAKDKAQWEGWILESRLKFTEKIGLNVVFLCLRRKFIPPFFETYQDITLTLFEKYDEKININLSSESREIIEILADSISPMDYFIPYQECFNLIKIKIDSYLVDSDSLDFLYNNLNVRGMDSYLLATNFILKMIMFMSGYQKNIIALIKDKMFENLKKFMKDLGQKFREKNHEEELKITDLNKLIGDNDLHIFKYFSATPEDKSFWRIKRSEFFVSCIDSLLTGGFVDIRKLITWFKEIPELRKLNNHLKDLLSIKIATDYKNKKEKISPVLDSIVNHIHRIKHFRYNEKIMCILIEKDYLRILHNNTNNSSYSEFLLYLLENHYSNKLFKAVYYFLKNLNKSNKLLMDEEENKKKNSLNDLSSYSILIEFFLKKYSDPMQGPILNQIACRGLFNLISFDVYNEKILIDLNCLDVICDKLSSPDEKLLYYSAELLSNFILSENLKPYINNIIKNHPNLILKLFKILKGSEFPGCYFSSKTILLIFQIIESLLNLPQSFVKEFICNENNQKIIKYVLNYLHEDYTLHPENIFHEISIYDKIFNILRMLINKKFDYFWYLETQFNLLKLLDLFCQKHFKYLFTENIFNPNNQNCSALFEDFEIKMFFFSFINFLKILKKNTNLKIKITSFCPTIYEIFLVIRDSFDSEIFNHPCPQCSVIQKCEHINIKEFIKFMVDL